MIDGYGAILFWENLELIFQKYFSCILSDVATAEVASSHAICSIMLQKSHHSLAVFSMSMNLNIAHCQIVVRMLSVVIK